MVSLLSGHRVKLFGFAHLFHLKSTPTPLDFEAESIVGNIQMGNGYSSQRNVLRMWEHDIFSMVSFNGNTHMNAYTSYITDLCFSTGILYFIHMNLQYDPKKLQSINYVFADTSLVKQPKAACGDSSIGVRNVLRIPIWT